MHVILIETVRFMRQVGDGEKDHEFWGPPESMDMKRPSLQINETNPGASHSIEPPLIYCMIQRSGALGLAANAARARLLTPCL